MNIPTKSTSNATGSISMISAAKSSSTSQKPLSLGTKRIDMGAAANFGKAPQSPNNLSSIHSPTHRDKPPTVGDITNDLITYTNTNNNNHNGSSNIVQKNINNDNMNNSSHLNNIDDLFKTCPVRKPPITTNATIADIADDDFNPRAVESASNDFGDFSSAFGAGNNNNGLMSDVGVAAAANTTPCPTVDDFADFSAFQSVKSGNQVNKGGLMDGTGGDLLSGANTIMDDISLTKPTASSSITTTDLLAGLGDLSIYQNMPMGKFFYAWKFVIGFMHY